MSHRMTVASLIVVGVVAIALWGRACVPPLLAEREQRAALEEKKAESARETARYGARSAKSHFTTLVSIARLAEERHVMILASALKGRHTEEQAEAFGEEAKKARSASDIAERAYIEACIGCGASKPACERDAFAARNAPNRADPFTPCDH